MFIGFVAQKKIIGSWLGNQGETVTRVTFLMPSRDWYKLQKADWWPQFVQQLERSQRKHNRRIRLRNLELQEERKYREISQSLEKDSKNHLQQVLKWVRKNILHH